jgi:hypothetical protein
VFTYGAFEGQHGDKEERTEKGRAVLRASSPSFRLIRFTLFACDGFTHTLTTHRLTIVDPCPLLSTRTP